MNSLLLGWLICWSKAADAVKSMGAACSNAER